MNPLARARFVLSRDQTLGTIAERLAAIHGDRRLVAEPGGHERTYHQASAQVSEWAGCIAARIQPGDRVVLATPNAYDLLLASKGGLTRDAALDLEGIRTVLALRSKYAQPQKVLSDPAKYIDETYLRAAAR